MSKPWEIVAAEQQAQRDAKIPKEWILPKPVPASRSNLMSVPYECGIMSKEELAWTERDATDLLRELAAGRIKSYDLTLAFCKRAAIAQQLLNCLTSIFFDEALATARRLDDILERTGQVIGPYHGLPFSIKDHFQLRGTDTSSGYIAWVGSIAQEDATVVDILRKAGAVFYVKTNNPQTLMHLETISNVYGRTLNPFNRNLTCGGSSGGEGALVGFCGSPIGLSADGGGSIRSPAANNGLFGLKISSNRIPLKGLRGSKPGCESFPIAVGPVCRSARDSTYFYKTILETEPWREAPEIVPIPWRFISLPEKITVGYFVDDNVVRPHPPVWSAMENVVASLQKSQRFEVVKWEPYQHDRGYDIVRQLYFEDDGETDHAIMAESGEPVLPLSSWVMKSSHTRRRTIEESWQLNVDRETYRTDYLKYWNQRPEVDFILCPAGPGAAPKHDTARYWGYTAVFNCLDYAACVFPSGDFVSPEKHPKDTSYKPRDNEFDAYNWGQYQPEDYAEAPICFQLVARRYEDEKVMAGVELVSKVLEAN